MLNHLYTIITDQAKAISFEEYENHREKEWKDLLNNKDTKESDIQKYLEENPSLVPCTSGHGPMHGVLFSQPILPGIQFKKPDFMWIGQNSAEIKPVLVEIEAPTKKWFTKNGQKTAEFTQAYNQLNQWRIWFSKPENVIQFEKLYKIRNNDYCKRLLKPFYVLIYGRKNDVIEYSEERAIDQKDDEQIMTYDRLMFDNFQRDCITCKIKETKFSAISFPEVVRIGPNSPVDFSIINNIDTAIDHNSELDEKRKIFLKGRLQYWIDWNKNSRLEIISSSDWE